MIDAAKDNIASVFNSTSDRAKKCTSATVVFFTRRLLCRDAKPSAGERSQLSEGARTLLVRFAQLVAREAQGALEELEAKSDAQLETLVKNLEGSFLATCEFLAGIYQSGGSQLGGNLSVLSRELTAE